MAGGAVLFSGNRHGDVCHPAGLFLRADGVCSEDVVENHTHKRAEIR